MISSPGLGVVRSWYPQRAALVVGQLEFDGSIALIGIEIDET